MNRKQFQRVAKIGLPTVLAVVIAYFLLRQIDLQQIPQTLSRLSIKALLIGFVCYCLLVLAKTLRFRVLLNLESRVHRIFPILALHTFWGNILPMRTGDVSYVYLMQRRQKVDATQGIASLLVASLIDLVLLMGLVIATAWLLRTELRNTFSGTVLYLVPLLIGGGLIAVVVFIYTAPNVCMKFAEAMYGTATASRKASDHLGGQQRLGSTPAANGVSVESTLFGSVVLFGALSRNPFRVSVLPCYRDGHRYSDERGVVRTCIYERL